MRGLRLWLQSLVVQFSQQWIQIPISDGEVKCRTGFISKFVLLAFVFIVCNGDTDLVMKRETSLTWFEEWILYFQWIWGCESTTRQSLAQQFKIDWRTAGRVVNSKL